MTTMRDLMFGAARWWGLNPFEVESLPLSDFIELVEQANRISEEDNDRGRPKF